jgi:polysaccharide export outer membrane protein
MPERESNRLSLLASHCRRSRNVLKVGILLGVIASCGTRSNAQAPSQESTEAYTSTPQSADLRARRSSLISAGDLLDVHVFDTPELSGKLQVDSSGRITLPVAGQVQVGGLSREQAATAIAERLRRAQVMLNPYVSILSVEYATEGVTLLGEVKRPGTYPLLGPHSLYDALAAAGGTTADEGATIKISHPGDPQHPEIIVVKTPNYSALQQSTTVRPGDTIVVSKADVIYVVGDVARSGQYIMQYGQHLTVLSAIALAQGTNRTAAMAHGAIIRQVGDAAQTLPFDLNKVMKNIEPNPVLEAGDVLVIPRSGFKTFVTTALPGATNAVSSAVASALILR